MGLFDSFNELLTGAVGDIFGGAFSSGESRLGGSSYSGSYLPVVNEQPVYNYPEPYPVQNVMAMAPMIQGVSRWAMQFPNLWQALQRLRANYRIPMTVEKLWSMLKVMGPAALVALIGSGALNELFVYHSTHKRRRMNVANTRALRRSVRRLKGFDRLSHRVSSQLSRVGGRRRSSTKRCGTCRKSPCAC